MSDELKIKLKWNLQALKEMLPEIVKSSQRRLGPLILDAVKAELAIGKSPVEGQGRLVGYSAGYKNEIKTIYSKKYGKRERPVNLYLSGTMVRSGYTKDAQNGVTVGFKDIKASYHNDLGAGKSKVKRRILPTNPGETFSRTIMKKVMTWLQNEIISKAIQRANRR